MVTQEASQEGRGGDKPAFSTERAGRQRNRQDRGLGAERTS